MPIKAHSHSSSFGVSSRPTITTVAVLTLLPLISLCLFVSLTARPVQAQTFKVIHSFTGGGDGTIPNGALIMDNAGNIFGTTVLGGAFGNGNAYKMSYKNGQWALAPLWGFGSGADGSWPSSGLIIGPKGVLYGQTNEGGGPAGGGTVYSLTSPSEVPPRVTWPWTEAVLHSFTGGLDGDSPAGGVILDSAGNVYGTAQAGGSHNFGVVYQLTPAAGGWTENILYSFGVGIMQETGLVLDGAGNLYGTTSTGANGCGVVYELSPSGGSQWTAQVLHTFQSETDGCWPLGNLMFDARGNLYGTTEDEGPYGENGAGTVYELTPSNGSWIFTVLYAFPAGILPPNIGPSGGVIMDQSGSLYGTTCQQGPWGAGTVYKVSPSLSGWTLTGLHEFTGFGDGSCPGGDLLMDADGNLYGTSQGGQYGVGVLWEITP